MRRVFSWGIRSPRLSLAIVLLVVLASALVLPGARFDPAPERIYPKDSPQARFAAEHRERFGHEDTVLFLMRAGDPLDPAITSVAEVLSARPEIAAVQAPTQAEVLARGDDGALGGRPLRPGESHPWTDGLLVSQDGDVGVIVAALEQDFANHQSRQVLIAAVEAAMAEAGGEWHISGMPAVRLGLVEVMTGDLQSIVPMAVVVAGVFFWLAFRDRRHVLLGVAAVGAGTIVAAGAYTATGTAFNVFAVAFLTIVVVVGTSDLVHLVHRFSDHFDALGDARQAAVKAAEEIGMSCLLTSTTTAAGFLALLTTDLPPIRTFGLATGVGVLITYVVGFLLVPPVLAWIGPPAAAARSHAVDGGARMGRMGRWVVARWRPMLWLWAAVTVACVLVASRLEVDHRVLHHLRSSHRLGQDHVYMEEHLGGLLPLEVAITLPGSPLAPETLAAVSELTAWMRAQPVVGYALSLPDVLQPAWEALSDAPGLPPTQEAAAQTALMVELAGRDLIEGFVVEEPSGETQTRIVARVRDSGHEPMMAMVDGLHAEAARLLGPAGGTVTVTGVAYLIQEVNMTVTEQFSSSFAVALLVIGLMWLARTRSVKRTLLALLPNGAPLVMLLAFMGATGIPLKPSTAMVMSIGLGIAVDDTIHFLAAYERAREEGSGTEAAIAHAFATAGRSMLDTSVMIGLGFGCLVFSMSPENQHFGILAAWVVVCAVLCDLFLLPPLLRWLDHDAAASDGIQPR